ncbi:5-deoxy-glucuronate isomerase [Nakamurella endophytica]|uniref:5-deoxy-glucuronate isomerase n=1 Tax=Nakamurella endophytica TaxID=1748367 RepID=A0A917WB41_9ACTN|nr:5-deoxy-glucuronate isomerase [Nakamurella endophytica]GGL87557.1 5-deoxy-glucuronate isomerase [Nakamurella endophytica]
MAAHLPDRGRHHLPAGTTGDTGAAGADLPGASGTDQPGASGADQPGASGTDQPGTSGAVVEVDVTPETAGWAWSGLRVLRLAPGVPATVATGDLETLVLPLSGGLEVRCDGDRLELAGRPDPFSGITDFAYLPIGAQAELESVSGAVVALPAARATRRLPFRYGPADEVPVELRGAGACSRQVVNFATPEAFETDRLIACEVLTPAGNWSSYPPHKHDEAAPHESELEEIYYYRFRSVAPVPVSGCEAGYQRVYGTPERPIDVLAALGDGDVVLIPHGWHGPSMASPGHDMYYLNVMAGPGERAWRISDDPDHGWIRQVWAAQEVDPRLPLYRLPARPADGGTGR